LDPIEKIASEIHQKYNRGQLITYETIDATQIPYLNHFDIIAFKSILGGIGRNDRPELKKKAVDEIHKALKENGILLF